MANPIQATPTSSGHPGRRSLVFGAIFSAAFTLIFHWLIWAFTDDFFYALLPAFLLGGLLFGMWWFMSHRVRVETHEGHLP